MTEKFVSRLFCPGVMLCVAIQTRQDSFREYLHPCCWLSKPLWSKPMYRRTRVLLAGHSKWANIRHKKGANDAKRAVLFTKLMRAVETASHQSSGERESVALSSAIAKAREASVPKDKIEAAIERGCKPRSQSDPAFELVKYEGVLPGGVGVVVEAASPQCITRTC